MLKAVLDTNIYISYLLSSANETTNIARAVELAGNGLYTPVVPLVLLDEIERVVQRPRFHSRISHEAVNKLVAFLKEVGEEVELSGADYAGRTADPKDDYLVEAALTTSAEFLVTGDRHVLGLSGSIDNLLIVPPAKFVQLLLERDADPT